MARYQNLIQLKFKFQCLLSPTPKNTHSSWKFPRALLKQIAYFISPRYGPAIQSILHHQNQQEFNLISPAPLLKLNDSNMPLGFAWYCKQPGGASQSEMKVRGCLFTPTFSSTKAFCDRDWPSGHSNWWTAMFQSWRSFSIPFPFDTMWILSWRSLGILGLIGM